MLILLNTYKLDVKLTHTYSSICLGTSTSSLPNRNSQSNQDLLVPASPTRTTKLGERGVGEYLGALLFWSGHFTSLGSRSLPLFFPPDHSYSVSSSVTALCFLWMWSFCLLNMDESTFRFVQMHEERRFANANSHHYILESFDLYSLWNLTRLYMTLKGAGEVCVPCLLTFQSFE